MTLWRIFSSAVVIPLSAKRGRAETPRGTSLRLRRELEERAEDTDRRTEQPNTYTESCRLQVLCCALNKKAIRTACGLFEKRCLSFS
eukprot:2299103-Rhodomonas_salina.1